jgi:aspartate carbamoyltransferase catalytic subunit
MSATTQGLDQARDYAQIYTPLAINEDFVGKHIITVDQFTRKDLQIIFDATASLKKRSRQSDRGLVEVCSGKIMATLFYEASTRTDMSFQAAMRHLGGEVVAASNGVQFSSIYKGENLADTVRATGCYADVIVLRHPEVGSSYEAAYYLDMLRSQMSRQPVISAAATASASIPRRPCWTCSPSSTSNSRLTG